MDDLCQPASSSFGVRRRPSQSERFEYLENGLIFNHKVSTDPLYSHTGYDVTSYFRSGWRRVEFLDNGFVIYALIGDNQPYKAATNDITSTSYFRSVAKVQVLLKSA